MVHFGPFWPEEVRFGLSRSANRTLAIPENHDIESRDLKSQSDLQNRAKSPLI